MGFIVADNVIQYTKDANDYYFPYGANYQTPPAKRIHSVGIRAVVVDGGGSSIWAGPPGGPANQYAAIRYVDRKGNSRIWLRAYLTNSHAGQRNIVYEFKRPYVVRGYLLFPTNNNASGIQMRVYLA